MAQRKRIRLGSMRLWVQSLASLSGLRIWRCHELWCRLQTRLGSGIAVAVVQAHGYSSDLIPSLGTSTCHGCGPKNQKKKKKKKKFTMRYSIIIRMATIKNSTTSNVVRDVKKMNHSHVVCENIRLFSHCERIWPLKKKCNYHMIKPMHFWHLSQRNENLYSHKKLYTNIYSS